MNSVVKLTDQHFTTVQAYVPITGKQQTTHIRIKSRIPIGLLVVYSRSCQACVAWAPQITRLTQNPSVTIALYEVVQVPGKQNVLSVLSQGTQTPITNMPTVYLVVNDIVVEQIFLQPPVTDADGLLRHVSQNVIPRLAQYSPNPIQQPFGHPPEDIFPSAQAPQLHQPQHQVPLHRQDAPPSRQEPPKPRIDVTSMLPNFTQDEMLCSEQGIKMGLCEIIREDSNTTQLAAANIARMKQIANDRDR